MPDHRVSLPILILAPLFDGMGFGCLGAILGSVAKICQRVFSLGTSSFLVLGVVFIGTYVTFLAAHAWIHASSFPHLILVGAALMGGLVVSVISISVWPIIWPRFIASPSEFGAQSWSLFRQGSLFSGILLAILVFARLIMTAPAQRTQAVATGVRSNQPNIVMIALDTARADHLSAYGYTRPTTPNIDSLARKGVLFEKVIAAAPWTLPSFAAVFTGLLPHQNQTGWDTPLGKGFPTLASILSSKGYHTAGFNANLTYGTARTGLARGFDLYDDDDGSFRTNLASIGFVKAFWWFFYYPFIRADSLQRRDARALNQDIFSWLGHPAKRPFFLFVNYFDVHEPYSPNPENENRFGDASKTTAQRIRAEVDGLPCEIDVPRSPAEQATLISGYDSSLAYADRHVGKLLEVIESSPERANTYIIVRTKPLARRTLRVHDLRV
jgi:hypothetical protein